MYNSLHPLLWAAKNSESQPVQSQPSLRPWYVDLRMEPVEVFAAMQQINANFLLSSRSCWRLVFHCSTMFYCVLLYMFYIVLLCSTMFYYVLPCSTMFCSTCILSILSVVFPPWRVSGSVLQWWPMDVQNVFTSHSGRNCHYKSWNGWELGPALEKVILWLAPLGYASAASLPNGFWHRLNDIFKAVQDTHQEEGTGIFILQPALR